MNRMTFSEPARIPDAYREIVLAFLREYWQARQWEWQNEFGMMQEINEMPATDDDYLRLMVADSIGEMARVAAGETAGLDKGIIYEGIQSLMERLFCPPGELAYDIPRSFWSTPFGAMVGIAFAWVQGNELITISEAAEISGKSVSAISEQARKGKLTSYVDRTEPNPRRQTRLLKSQIMPKKKKKSPQ